MDRDLDFSRNINTFEKSNTDTCIRYFMSYSKKEPGPTWVKPMGSKSVSISKQSI